MADPELNPIDKSSNKPPGSEDKFLTSLYSSLDYSQTEFDKSLTFISAGLLAGSFAFIDKIVKLDHAICKNLLLYGWAVLGLSIGISAFGHLRSIKHIAKSIAIYSPVDDQEQRDARKNGNKEIVFINYLTIILILLGSFCVFWFIYENFNH